MRFYIHSLGCKINQYESQAIREAWLAQGMVEAAAPGEADLVLTLTCAVTAKAVADSRGTVRRSARQAPGARLVVAGCASQVDPEAFQALSDRVVVVSQAAKPGLCRSPLAPVAAGARSWPDLAVSGSARARPVLKIQDGCSHACTYCIVPRARGTARSRPSGDILAEAGRMLAAGHRELVLSGINLGQFRLDGQGGDFWDLVAALERDLAPEWAGRARVRLSSLDPGMLGAKALDTLAASRLVCPHLHLSLQSADPGVLAAMGRGHYDVRDILDFLDGLGRCWPVYALGVDLLTGFPGESDQAFAATLEFCRLAPLTYAHVFPYSRRPGTVAAKAPGQIPHAVKKARAAALRQAADEREAAFAARLAGLPAVCVAVERVAPTAGVCEYYVECRVRGPRTPDRGELLRARPLAAKGCLLEVEARECPA